MISEMTTVYNGDLSELVQGTPDDQDCVAINMDDVRKLASWRCDTACGRTGAEYDAERERNGYCDVCGNEAAFMIVMCPYIDMTRTA